MKKFENILKPLINFPRGGGSHRKN